MGIDPANITFPMDRMLQHLFPWLGVLSGPLASMLFVQQWKPASWMEISMHTMNAVSMVQLLHLLVRNPEMRWAIFAVATIQMIAWMMAYGWYNLGPDDLTPAPPSAYLQSAGRESLRYVHLSMAVCALAIVGGVLLAWSHGLQTLPPYAMVWLLVILVLAGGIYAVFETPWKLPRSEKADILAVINLGIGLYIVTVFLAGYRTDISVEDLWRPVIRWCYQVAPTLPMIYWTGGVFFFGFLSMILFFSLMAALYMQYYRKDKPTDRRMRVAAGTLGTLAVLCLFLSTTFVHHVGLAKLTSTRTPYEHSVWMAEFLSTPPSSGTVVDPVVRSAV